MMLLHVMWNVILNNQFITDKHPKKAFCLYFSLDDTNNELMPRIIAMDQKIKINQVLFPSSVHSKTVLDKREAGIQKLKENVQFFAMKDANNGSSIERVEELIIEYREMLEQMAPNEYQLCAFIDNFHDLTTTEPGYQEDNARFDYISGKLTDIANEHLIPMMCSAEFRKISTHKRPEEADIKSSGKITYESKGTILVYNEVGVKKDQANVHWEMKDAAHPEREARKMPVLEMNIAKNKFNSYKGTGFLNFIPEMATFIEPDEESIQYYRQQMRG